MDFDIMSDAEYDLLAQGKEEALQEQLNYQRGYITLFNGITDAIRMLDRQRMSAETLRSFLCDLQREAENDAISTQPFYTSAPDLR